MSIDRRTDRDDVVHIYNRILLTHKKNEIGPCKDVWIDLDIVKQSEVSQKEKNKWHILTHIFGVEREVVLMNLSAQM